MGAAKTLDSVDGLGDTPAICAVDTQGVAFCWGSNQRNHLGKASPDDAFFPTRVGFP
jgi:hypothetical protein